MRRGKSTSDTISDRLRNITADIKRYIEKRMELYAISVGEGVAKWLAGTVQRTVGAAFLFGALVFLLIALALFLGSLLNSLSLGFVIVSVPFLVCGYLFLNLKPRSLLKKLQEEFEEELLHTFVIDRDEEKEKLLSEKISEIDNKIEDHVREPKGITQREKERTGS